MSEPRDVAWDESRIRQGVFRCAMQRVRATGELVLPALPALAEHYVDLLVGLFGQLGRPFNTAERGDLLALVQQAVDDAFKVSASSNIFIRYRAQRDGGISYAVAGAPVSMSHEYGYWLDQKEAPFGTHADARVLDVAAQLVEELAVNRLNCLDLGSGSGRNGLSLAERGHSVHAVDAAPDMVRLQQRLARQRGLDIDVSEGDFLEDSFSPGAASYHLVVVSEVTSHFRDVSDLRVLMCKVSEALEPNGRCVVSVFLPRRGYAPDAAMREISQTVWSTLFTHEELNAALTGLDLVIDSDDSFADYERDHQAAGVWPHTQWVEGWARGADVIADSEHATESPIELRWIVLRKLS